MEINQSGINRLIFIESDEPSLLRKFLGEKLMITSSVAFTPQPKELEAVHFAKASLASIKKRLVPVALKAAHGPMLSSENDLALVAERLGLYYADLEWVDIACPGDVILIYPTICWTRKTHAEQKKFMDECKVLLLYVGEKLPRRLRNLEKGVEWQARPTSVDATPEQSLLDYGKPLSVFDLLKAQGDGMKVAPEKASKVEEFVRACPAFKGGSVAACADLLPYAENPLVQAALKVSSQPNGDTPLSKWLEELLDDSDEFDEPDVDGGANAPLANYDPFSIGGVHYPRLGPFFFDDIRREREEPHLSAHLVLPPDMSKEKSCSEED